MRLERLRVGNKYGAITAYCQFPDGYFGGLSAAHVLQGSDGRLTPNDEVEVWDAQNRVWEIGPPGEKLIYEKGTGKNRGFGVIDTGLFPFNDVLNNRLQATSGLKPLALSPLLRNKAEQNLLGQHVFGFSVQYETRLVGKVVKVHEVVNLRNRKTNRKTGYACDVVIEILRANATTKGDSGILWYDEDDHAFAMHFGGFKRRSGPKFAMATFMDRVFAAYAKENLVWWQAKGGVSS